MVGYLSWIKLKFPQTFSSSQLSRPQVPTVCWTFLAQCPTGPPTPCLQVSSAASPQASLLLRSPAPGKITSLSQSPRPETGSHPWLILSLLPRLPNPGWSTFPWKHLTSPPSSAHSAAVMGPVCSPGSPAGSGQHLVYSQYSRFLICNICKATVKWQLPHRVAIKTEICKMLCKPQSAMQMLVLQGQPPDWPLFSSLCSLPSCPTHLPQTLLLQLTLLLKNG